MPDIRSSNAWIPSTSPFLALLSLTCVKRCSHIGLLFGMLSRQKCKVTALEGL